MRIGSIKTRKKGPEPINLVYGTGRIIKNMSMLDGKKPRKYGSISQPRTKVYACSLSLKKIIKGCGNCQEQ
jgi:hypothetical protein